MARRGRFGRATTGSSNLSSFISGLVQQSISMNERALINAFNDQTMFQGGVPNSGDIESYVSSRIEGLDPNSAEYAYYMNMLETAKRQERGRQAQSAATSFNVTMGDSFGDFYDQISGLLQDGDLSESERQEFESLLTQKTAEYVDIVSGQYKNGAVTYEELLSKTDAAIGLLEGTVQENAIVLRADAIMSREAQSLDNGSISVDEFKARSQASFRGLDPEAPVSWDLNNKLFTTIWNREIDGQYGKVLAAQDKPTGTKIKKTQAYLEWARGKLSDLEASGVTGGELYDTIKNNIRSYQNNLSDLRVQAGNELYASRKGRAESSRSVLDQFAAQASLYVSGAAADKLRDLTGGVTLNNLLSIDPFAMVRYFDINPSAQADFDAALLQYRDDSKSLVATAKAIGAGTAEAMSLRNDAVEIARYTKQDTTLEDYEDAYDKKLQLIGRARGDDSVIEAINSDWLKFLQGKDSGSFGKGISPAGSSAFAALVGNEVAVYELGKAGASIENIGTTLLDYIQDTYPEAKERGITNSQLESEFAAKTAQNSQLLKDGKAVVVVGANGVGNTVGIRQADQSKGEFIFAEKNANGVIRPTIHQGVPVNGTSGGSEIEGAQWGWYYPATKTWVDRNGKTYTKPPIQMRNGGAPEYDENGNPTRVTFELASTAVDQGKLAEGVTPTSAARYPAVDEKGNSTAVEISRGAAIVGTMSWMSQGVPAVINKNTLDAITYSFTEEEKADIEGQVQIYNERIGRFDVGYGESRLTPETTTGSSATSDPNTFDKFLGSSSTEGGKPKYASIIAPGAKPGTWVYKRVNYADAYEQVRPGVFVRKDSATAIGDPKTGAAAPEANQFFPKTIDVSQLVDTPAIKPYVDSGLIKTPNASGASTTDIVQNYFFRNSGVSSINNRDIAESRARTGSGSITPIQTPTNLMVAQPIVDFRASERASLGTVGVTGGISTLKPISLSAPANSLTSQPIVDFRASERASLGTIGITPIKPISPISTAPIGKIGGR